MAYIPVGQGGILAENIACAAEGQIQGRFFYDINIRQHEYGRNAGHCLFIALPGHGGHGGAEAVYAGRGRAGDKRNPSVIGTIAGGIMNGAASDGNQIIDITVQLFHNLSHCDFIGM